MAIGYSGTPLCKKLGIATGADVATLERPSNYEELLGEIPAGVKFSTAVTGATSLIHVFVTERAVLEQRLRILRPDLRDSIPLWISWPKKAAKVKTDITEDTIRELALPLGLVDIKVCAVSEVWSGLKLVVRKELRGKSAA